MKFVITLQESNHYNPTKGDKIDIFGQSLSILTCSKLIKDLNSKYQIDIYAPENILKEFHLPSTDLINLINREERDLISCLNNSYLNLKSKVENLIWINSRYIGIDFLEIKKAYTYKVRNNIDILFSSEAFNYFITDDSLSPFNLLNKNYNNLPFFDRKRLKNTNIFNKKFFIVSSDKINQLNQFDSLKINFYPFKGGLLIDSLKDYFSEVDIAKLFID